MDTNVLERFEELDENIKNEFVSKYDAKNVELYDVNDIIKNKIKLSVPFLNKRGLAKFHLLYPNSEGVYTRFMFETPYLFVPFGLDNENNKKFWMKVEIRGFKKKKSEEYVLFELMLYLNSFLQEKLKIFFDDNLLYYRLMSLCDNPKYPPFIKLRIPHMKNYFNVNCFNKEGDHKTVYDVGKCSKVKLLLNPLDFWSNEGYFGSMWSVNKLIID